MSDTAARVAAATGVPLDRASFYLDAAAGDEAGAVAMIRENEPATAATAPRPPPPPPRARSPVRAAPPRPTPPRPRAPGAPPPRRGNPPSTAASSSPLFALLRLPFTALRAAATLASAVLAALTRPGSPIPGLPRLAAALRPRPPTDPAADAAAFASAWEAAHGPGRGPAWAPLGWRAAADAAAASHALLFAYFRSPRHSDTPGFEADTLCDGGLVSELGGSGRYVAWGGDVTASSDAAALAGALRLRAYPAVALLRGPASRVALAAAAEGAARPSALLDLLARAQAEHGPGLAAERDAARAREADRALRAEQDAAFEAALAADRGRDAAAAAAAAQAAAAAEAEAAARAAAEREAAAAAAKAAETAAALAARAAAAAAALPPEPAPGTPGAATIRVRLRAEGAGAAPATRRFPGTATADAVYAWVDSLPGHGCLGYDLVTAFPRTVLQRSGGGGGDGGGGGGGGAPAGRTLAELGLAPQAALLVEPRD